MRHVVLATLLMLFCACAARPDYEVTTLPNGKQLKIIGINTTAMYSPNGANKYLSFNYQTDLPISDEAAIGKEADEIMVYFKNNAEQAGVSEVVITARSELKGTFIKEGSTQAFAYKKSPGGKWLRSGG